MDGTVGRPSEKHHKPSLFLEPNKSSRFNLIRDITKANSSIYSLLFSDGNCLISVLTVQVETLKKGETFGAQGLVFLEFF